MDNFKYLIDKLYILSKIPFRFCVNGGGIEEPVSCIDDLDPFQFDKDLLSSLVNDWHGTPFLKLEGKSIIYGVCCDHNGIACVLGPAAINTLSSIELYRYRQTHHMSDYKNYKITQGSIIQIASLLALLHKEMNHDLIELNQILLVSEESKTPTAETSLLPANHEFFKEDA